MNRTTKIIKRIIDLLLSVIFIPLFLIPIIILIILSSFDTKKLGLFIQLRIGQYSKVFLILKIRTIKSDNTISTFGQFLRTYKLDELPQLFNILIGDMSFVGPRPDLQGYADKLTGQDKIIQKLKPGLTGPASIKYYFEESLLERSKNPQELVKEIWKEKVEINKRYALNYYLYKDFLIIYKTIKVLFNSITKRKK